MPIDEFGLSEHGKSKLYPGFRHNSPPLSSRVVRIETGAQRIQGGQIRPTSGQYARLPIKSLLTRSPGIQGLNLTSSQISKLGSVPPASSVCGFAYTSDGASITWYWDGTNGSSVPVISRSDGTHFTVPTTGSGLQVTGLSATDYYFLPFWSTSSQSNVGWVQGTIGTPQIAFTATDILNPITVAKALIGQNLQQMEALSNGFIKATCAIGGSGNQDPTGCVRHGTNIVALGDLPYTCEVLDESQWVMIRVHDGRELICTCDHRLYHAESGKVLADTLAEGDEIIMDNGVQRIAYARFIHRPDKKWKIEMPVGHLYWANGFLSHNQKPRSG